MSAPEAHSWSSFKKLFLSVTVLRKRKGGRKGERKDFTNQRCWVFTYLTAFTVNCLFVCFTVAQAYYHRNHRRFISSTSVMGLFCYEFPWLFVVLFTLLRERKLPHRKSWPHSESVIWQASCEWCGYIRGSHAHPWHHRHLSTLGLCKRSLQGFKLHFVLSADPVL